MASSTNTGKYFELPGRESNPGLPRDRRGHSPLYYRGLSMLNRLWVYKFFMILKYCNRWHPLLIQENKLNSPAGNRTLVSRVTDGDNHHYTTEDCLCWTGCEFINSMILKQCNRWRALLIQENKLNSPAGNRTMVSRVTGGDTHHYNTEDSVCWTGCELINSWWFWSNIIDCVLY